MLTINMGSSGKTVQLPINPLTQWPPYCNIFGEQILSHPLWPARSSNSVPCNFFYKHTGWQGN